MGDVTKFQQIHQILKNNNIDLSSIDSDDVEVLLKELMKGEFDKEVFSSFMKEANITLQTVTNGIKEFINQTGYASNKYSDTLSKMVEDLMERVKQAKSIEEEERLWKRIDVVLDRLQKEAEEGRSLFKTIGSAAVIAGAVVLGIGLAAATKNPTVLKEGVIAATKFKR